MTNRSLAFAAAFLMLTAACRAEPELPWKLRNGLRSPDSAVRLAAVGEAGKTNAGNAAAQLGKIAAADSDPRVRAAALEALSRLDPPLADTSSILILALADPDPAVRETAVRARPQIRTRFTEEIPYLEDLLGHPNPAVRATAVQAIADFSVKARSRLDSIRPLLADADPMVRDAAAGAVEQIERPYATTHNGRNSSQWLAVLKSSTDTATRAEAIGGLSVTGDQGDTGSVADALAGCLGDPDENLRFRAAWALMDLVPRVPGLRPKLSDSLSGASEPAARMIRYILERTPESAP